MVRFDAYSATTTEAHRDDLMALIFQPGDEVRSGKGFHTFGERHAWSTLPATRWGRSCAAVARPSASCSR